MRRAVTCGLIPALLAAVVGLGFASSAFAQNGCGCQSACGCDTCCESNGDVCGRCCPYTLFTPLIGLARLLGAGCDPCGCRGCGGEVWIGEWRNRCCDPCDNCGNFVGGPAPYANGAVIGTTAPAAGGCNCGGYAHRGGTTVTSGYANTRSASPTTYVSQRSPTRSSGYTTRPTNAGYAARPTTAAGEVVGQPRIIAVSDDVVTPARTAGTSSQPRSR